MTKSKKLQIIGLAAAIFMAVSGIVMVAYAATLVKKTITGGIIYNPEYIDIAGAYYVSEDGVEATQSKGSLPATLVFPEVSLANSSGFVVYELTITTKYSGVTYDMTVTPSLGITASGCTDSGGLTPKSLPMAGSPLSSTPTKVFIRIDLATTTPGSYSLTIVIDATVPE